MPGRSVAIEKIALLVCRQRPPRPDLPGQLLEGRQRFRLFRFTGGAPSRVMPANRRLCAGVWVDQQPRRVAAPDLPNICPCLTKVVTKRQPRFVARLEIADKLASRAKREPHGL